MTVIGLNEDGCAGLSQQALAALAGAQVIVGAPRHLALVQAGSRGRPWPVPFDIAPVLALRGQPVVVLVSGDPFWFGAGTSLARQLAPGEWRCHGQPSTFSLAAARLGWALEQTDCLGLHARPVEQLRPLLTPGRQFIALLADADAVPPLATWLAAQGWGDSELWVLQALGGPRERCWHGTAHALARELLPEPAQEPAPASAAQQMFATPLCVALHARGGAGLPNVAGRADAWFAHDGQITKAPVRAMTLAALAPRRGQRLWDIGAGSGSVAVEWCLAGGTAIAIEQQAQRVQYIEANRQRFGLQAALQVVPGQAPAVLAGLAPPDAVFVGGGFSPALWSALLPLLPAGCRLVANAVALQTQALLLQLHAEWGGELLHIQLAHAQPLGRMHSWQGTRALVQWAWQRP